MSHAVLSTAFGFPPEGEVFTVDRLDLRMLPGEHPWYAENRLEVAENWMREVDANPHLYDGKMAFQREVRLVDGASIEARAHLVPFSAFLHWRKTGRQPGGTHLFAMPLILSSDNALIAIRMAPHTANPGKIYCPAGSMDEHDIVDGYLDVDRNMRREVLEETGLDLAQSAADAALYATHGLNTVMIFRIFRFQESAEKLLAGIAEHIKHDPEPEISEALAIRSVDEVTDDFTFFMHPVLKWLFG
jgi:8-oxo-dGTP pyrophosphatase MutT (NUDIX family)